jgi:hypothetical protein
VSSRKDLSIALSSFGVFISYAGIADFQCLLYIESRESFLKVKGVWWICCTEKNVCVFVAVCSEIGKEIESGRPFVPLAPPPL